MDLDNADTVRYFVSRIRGQHEHSNLNTLTVTQPANEYGPVVEHDRSDGAKTPPHTPVAGGGENHHLTSPEAHPKPSPLLSGLQAPNNTPKTAASSPRLTAMSTHNEDVAEAFSEYVNTVNSRPLSESMWAPASARYKPSMLSGARSTRVLTPVKSVEPNPATNDTFDRMSFKAADSAGDNLIGDRLTQALFSKAPPSFISQTYILANKIQEGKVGGDFIQAKLENASSNAFGLRTQNEPTENDQKVQKTQIKTKGADTEDLPTIIDTDLIGKENVATPTSKTDVPPHLRATSISPQKSIKAKTKPSPSEGIDRYAMGKISDTGTVKNSVQAATSSFETKVITSLASTKPTKPLTDPSSASEDLEHKTYFGAWPKSEERSKPAAQIRKVIIKDLPRDSTAAFVASLVYGGPVEEIQVRSSTAGNLSAAVLFMDGGDCMKFHGDTSNGLVYKKDAKGRELVLFVELSKDVDVVGGLLRGWIASGVTRCVRAVGVETEWGMDGLLKMAERKNRKVEKIVDGQNSGGARSVVFRFCKVEDAVQFRAALSRDEEWEHCNIHYAADPCATASGVHLES